MNVVAFITEATEKSLKIDEAIRGVDTAKEAVEAARAAVEAAKANVEVAKQAVTAAKEDLDGYADRAEEFGLTKAKFKDAVERMKSLLADIGAVEGTASDTSEQAEPKQKTPRKRKTQEVVETVQEPTTTAADPDVIMIGEIKDVATAISVENAAEKAAEIGHVEIDAVAPSTEEEPAVEVESEQEVVPATEEVVEPVAPATEAVEVATFFQLGEATEAPVEETTYEELDNSFAEQELTDFVDELGSSDIEVNNVLTSAIKVVSWHATNVLRKELRTSPSPLTLAGVLAAEGIDYMPQDIATAYLTATAHGGEKLAAAISWFNKGIDLLAEAKDVEDFTFKPKPAPVQKTVEKAEIAAAVVTEVEETPEAEAEIGGFDGEAETIEDMEIFAAPSDETDDAEVPTSVAATPVVETVEEPKPAAPAPKRPAWLNK